MAQLHSLPLGSRNPKYTDTYEVQFSVKERQYRSVSGAYQSHTEPLSALMCHQLCQRAEKKESLFFSVAVFLSVFMPCQPIDS